MARYTYRCAMHGQTDRDFPLGRAPRSVACSALFTFSGYGWAPDQVTVCALTAQRYFGPDACPEIAAQDPFRRFDLSPRKEDAQVRQQRYVDAPRDRADARAQEAARGISFVGDDTSGLTPAARRGIEKYADKVKTGEVRT